MFIALYEMIAKKGFEQEFEKSWGEVTEAIHRVRGSLGSRLHTTEINGTYIAYAQWPSKELFDSGIGVELFTIEESNSLNMMNENSLQIKLLHSMNVCDDRLKK
jgi:heme-degrading monooxygenase HmoA